MKTRIISAVVGLLLFAVIIILSTDLVLKNNFPHVLTAALAILAAIGTHEILHNTKIVKRLCKKRVVYTKKKNRKEYFFVY